MPDFLGSPPSNIERIVIIDPSLVSRFGHHYNYVKAVVSAARARGLQTLVLCSKNALPEIVAELSATPFFDLSTYTELVLSQSRSNSDYEPWVVQGGEMLALNMYFLSNLYEISRQLRPGDQIFFHTIFPNQLIAICQWLTGFSEEDRPHSTVVLRFWSRKRFDRPVIELCSSILNRPEMKCRVCSDTDELTALYADLMGRPVDRIAIPHMPGAAAEDAPRRRFRPAELPAETVTIGYLGDTRADKGFLFFPAAIEELLRRGTRSFHILAQISGNPGFSPEVLAEIHRLAAIPGVTLVLETLSSDDYYALLQDCDIVLISYDPVRYRECSSGIFTEAIAAGKVAVVPAGTSMAREAWHFRMGHSCIQGFDSMAIADALQSTLNDYPALAARSRAGVEAVKAYHNPDTVLDYLVGNTLSGS